MRGRAHLVDARRSVVVRMRQHEREQASEPSAPSRWSAPHRRNSWITSSASPGRSTGCSASSFCSPWEPPSPGASSGSIPTRTPAEGILISGGGRVVDAVSAAPGRLASIEVTVGDRVTQGQPIARDRPDRHRAAPSQRGRSLFASASASTPISRSKIERELASKAQEFRQARGSVQPDHQGDRRSASSI